MNYTTDDLHFSENDDSKVILSGRWSGDGSGPGFRLSLGRKLSTPNLTAGLAAGLHGLHRIGQQSFR